MLNTKEYFTNETITTTEEVAENYLSIFPTREKKYHKFYLTKSKSAWITIEWISDKLISSTKKQYKNLFNLRPLDRGKVIMFDKETPSQRWHKSYLKTPLRKSIHEKRSYMYSGKEFDGEATLPILFQPYLDELNKNENVDFFNQVIINWYLNGNDFIAAHSDCQLEMKPNASISILTLNENDDDFRELKFISKKTNADNDDSIYNQVKIAALDGCIITMHGDLQQKFRHKISKNLFIKTSRISMTFRKF